MTGFRAKKGFTIIEVLLVLAISGAIFAMILSGTSTSAAKRRYNDSVNDLAENLRNAYSATINVENTRENKDESNTFCTLTSAIDSGFRDDSSPDRTNNIVDNYPGRTNCAVYGQLVTFGENNSTKVNYYDIIGRVYKYDNNNVIKDINPTDSDDVLTELREVSADVVSINRVDKNSDNCTGGLAGTSRNYVPMWDAKIEDGTTSRGLYKGAVMIVRAPVSGTIHTYFYSDSGNAEDINSNTIEVGKFSGTKKCVDFSNDNNYLGRALKSGKMIKAENTDGIAVCVGSEDLFAVANRRRAIKIHANGSNENAVELLPADSEETRKACK